MLLGLYGHAANNLSASSRDSVIQSRERVGNSNLSNGQIVALEEVGGPVE
jgi:hypothetical protein